MSSDLLRENCDALRALIRRTGVRPRGEAGQHFLIDSRVVDDLVSAAEVQNGDCVLEIGPGFGVVTEALLEKGANVVAVELDRRLGEYLRNHFARQNRFTLVQADVLRLRLDEYVEDGRYKLVSSLPYGITSLVLRSFLEHRPRPTLLSLLIQREVAARAAAKPGRMSLLSVSCQYLGSPIIVRTVSSASFYPEPAVDGAILRVAVKPLPPEDERSALFRTCRIGFSARRKMLRNNLDAGFHLAKGSGARMLEELGLAGTCRPQDLAVQDWLKCSKKLL